MENPKIRVVFINHTSNDKGGATKALIELIEGLKNAYDIIPLVIIPKEGWFTKQLKQRKIEYECFQYDWWLSKEPLKLRNISDGIKVFTFARYIKQKYNPVIIHSNTSVIAIGWWLSKLLGVKHVWHIREIAEKSFGLHYVLPGCVVRTIYQDNSALLAISPYVKNEMINKFGLQNVCMIWDAVPIVDRYIKTENNIVEMAVIGYVGNEKNQMLVLEAAYRLVRQGICNFRINIVGEGKIQPLLRYVREKNIEQYVVFHGYRDDIDVFLKNMNVGIVASNYEAFGRVTIEYMSHYMPVVGVNNGATDYLVKEGFNGWKFEAYDVCDLSNAMIKAINNKDKMLAIRARQVAEKFSTEKMIEKVYKLYSKIMEKR